MSQLFDYVWDFFIGDTRLISQGLFTGKHWLFNTVATRYDVMNKYTIASNRLIYSLESLD
jgi:hypothetical protein